MSQYEDEYKEIAGEVVKRASVLIKALEKIKEDYTNLIDGKSFFGLGLPVSQIGGFESILHIAIYFKEKGSFLVKYRYG